MCDLIIFRQVLIVIRVPYKSILIHMVTALLKHCMEDADSALLQFGIKEIL